MNFAKTPLATLLALAAATACLALNSDKIGLAILRHITNGVPAMRPAGHLNRNV